MKAAWIFIAVFTWIVELSPIGSMPFWSFEFYNLGKVCLFFVLGFVAPLAFYRLSGIGISLVFSVGSALSIEVFQGVLKNGHAFHWYELTGKLALIAIGLAIALNRRYELRISVGPFDIRLQTAYFR